MNRKLVELARSKGCSIELDENFYLFQLQDWLFKDKGLYVDVTFNSRNKRFYFQVKTSRGSKGDTLVSEPWMKYDNNRKALGIGLIRALELVKTPIV